MLETSRRQRRRRRRTVWRRVGFLFLLVAVFVVGVAVGEALNDAPKRGEVVTSVRTLSPLPQQPPRRTVTVTVTQP
jgi:hypothetical protein